MLRDIRLRFWPSYYDCLRWSESGVLAVLANEYVHILVPTKEDFKKVKGTPQFDIAKADFKVSERDNVVVNEPTAIYSIGEEQGPGYVKAVEWSQLGLSHNRGCFLAVLTTTHQLKLFETDVRPTSEWKTAHNISNLISEYDGWNHKESDSRLQRLRSRSRSIAWSFRCDFEGLKWGHTILAAANDNLEVVFIHVQAAICKVIKVVRLDQREGVGFYPRMSWSPWTSISKQRRGSFFTIVNRGKVILYRVFLTLDEDSEITLDVDEQKPFVLGHAVTEIHPVFNLVWYKKEINGHMLLAYAIQRQLRVVAIRPNAEELVQGKSLHVWEFDNGFVEPVSGLVISLSSKSVESVDIHLSTILGNTQIVNWKFNELDPDGDEPMEGGNDNAEWPLNASSGAPKQNEQHWEYLIQEKKQDFIAEYDINSATCKVWGMAVSPLGGMVAVVISMEPDDSLQYVTHSKETSRLLFGWEIDGKTLVRSIYGGSVLPSAMTNSSEDFILECANLYNSEASAASRIGGNASPFEYLKTLLQKSSANFNLNPPQTNTNTQKSISSVATLLSQNLFEQSALTALRLSTCLRLFPQCRREDGSLIIPLDKSEPQIVATLVLNTLAAARTLEFTDIMSRRIIYSTAMIGIIGLRAYGKVILEPCRDALLWLQKTDPDLRLQDELDFVTKVLTKGDGGGAGMDQAGTFSGMEDKMTRCIICEGSLSWEDLGIAECSEGHRHPRCSITFLAIQSGDAWRTCTVCERSVLAPATENVTTEGESASETLLTLLTTAWDICVHCGGRFK